MQYVRGALAIRKWTGNVSLSSESRMVNDFSFSRLAKTFTICWEAIYTDLSSFSIGYHKLL